MSPRGSANIHLAGAAALALATVGGYLLGVEPGLAARAGSIARASTLDERRREVVVAETNLRTDQINAASLRARVDALPFRLEPVAAVNQRLVAVTRAAESAGVKVNAIDPGKPEPGGLYTTIPISLSGACTYGSFNTLLRTLRAEFPDTGVAEFTIVGTPNNKDGNPVFSLLCTWYAQPVATAGAADGGTRATP